FENTPNTLDCRLTVLNTAARLEPSPATVRAMGQIRKIGGCASGRNPCACARPPSASCWTRATRTHPDDPRAGHRTARLKPTGLVFLPRTRPVSLQQAPRRITEIATRTEAPPLPHGVS